MNVTQAFHKSMTLDQQIKQLVKEKVKNMKKTVKSQSPIHRLECFICGGKKLKLTGEFEQWEKELFDKSHEHKIRRYLLKYFN